MRRPLGLAGFCLLAFTVACSDDAPNQFESSTDESGAATDTGALPDMPVAETGDAAADEVGDGDGDPGDGDGDPVGDGDGELEGDGDGDPGLPACGNGVVEAGEQCDGTELGGIACTDLGYSGGTLGCDPVTCTYDASGCMAGGGDGGSGGTTG